MQWNYQCSYKKTKKQKNQAVIVMQLHNIKKEILSSKFQFTLNGHCCLTSFSSTDDENEMENDNIHYYVCKELNLPFHEKFDSINHWDEIICIITISIITLGNPVINEFRTLPKPRLLGDSFWVVEKDLAMIPKPMTTRLLGMGFILKQLRRLLRLTIWQLIHGQRLKLMLC